MTATNYTGSNEVRIKGNLVTDDSIYDCSPNITKFATLESVSPITINAQSISPTEAQLLSGLFINTYTDSPNIDINLPTSLSSVTQSDIYKVLVYNSVANVLVKFVDSANVKFKGKYPGVHQYTTHEFEITYDGTEWLVT